MGSNKKQGRMKEEKTRGKQTEPQLIQCVSLVHTQVKGCFQNCLLWSRTSTAFLFLPQDDRELPRRISSTLKALLRPTKNTKKHKCQPKRSPESDTLHGVRHRCTQFIYCMSTSAAKVATERRDAVANADQYSKHRRASKGLSAHTRLFV